METGKVFDRFATIELILDLDVGQNITIGNRTILKIATVKNIQDSGFKYQRIEKGRIDAGTVENPYRAATFLNSQMNPNIDLVSPLAIELAYGKIMGANLISSAARLEKHNVHLFIDIGGNFHFIPYEIRNCFPSYVKMDYPLYGI